MIGLGDVVCRDFFLMLNLVQGHMMMVLAVFVTLTGISRHLTWFAGNFLFLLQIMSKTIEIICNTP